MVSLKRSRGSKYDYIIWYHHHYECSNKPTELANVLLEAASKIQRLMINIM